MSLNVHPSFHALRVCLLAVSSGIYSLGWVLVFLACSTRSMTGARASRSEKGLV